MAIYVPIPMADQLHQFLSPHGRQGNVGGHDLRTTELALEMAIKWIENTEPEIPRLRAALEQIRHGLGSLPYPREYPETCKWIDELVKIADAALEGK